MQASDARAESTGKRIRIALQHVEGKGTQGVRNGGAGRIGIFVRVQLNGWCVRLLARRVALHGLEMGAFVSHAGMPVVRDEPVIWACLEFCHRVRRPSITWPVTDPALPRRIDKRLRP